MPTCKAGSLEPAFLPLPAGFVLLLTGSPPCALPAFCLQDPEDHAEELTALASVSDLDPVAAGASILQQRAWRGVHDIVQTALSAGLDAADAALPYLVEVRWQVACLQSTRGA